MKTHIKQPTYKERLQKAFDIMDKGVKPEEAAHGQGLNWVTTLAAYEERKSKK